MPPCHGGVGVSITPQVAKQLGIIMSFEDTCEVHCTDTDRRLTADILDFSPGRYLNVSINKQIKLTMQYEPRHKIYIGSMTGLEFTTPGPKEFVVKKNFRGV